MLTWALVATHNPIWAGAAIGRARSIQANVVRSRSACHLVAEILGHRLDCVATGEQRLASLPCREQDGSLLLLAGLPRFFLSRQVRCEDRRAVLRRLNTVGRTPTSGGVRLSNFGQRGNTCHDMQPFVISNVLAIVNTMV